jgi:hypothetical protein
MKRRWNLLVWIGFVVVLLGVFSYLFVFIRFPVTRDFPWASLLLFVAGGWLLATGLRRAFGQPERYGGKVSGVVLTALSLVIIGLFCYGIFGLTKGLPSTANAPHDGTRAPDFTLSDVNGKSVTLSGLLKSNRAVLLIFYRGYW